MNLKRLITLAITFTICANCWGQTYRSGQNYPFYKYSWEYTGSSSSTVFRNGYSIDTLVTKLGISKKVEVSSRIDKKENKLASTSSYFYDSLGRTIETKGMNENGDWFYKNDYTQKNTTIRSSNHYYNKYITNDSGYVLSTYWEYYNSKGKAKSQRLTKYTYNHSKWLSAMYTNKNKKDTVEMALNLKNYYENDTGSITKKEIYRKGKVKYTYVYDCSLAQEVATPKKDTTRVCRNEATDDRGYTYYTSFSYKQNKTYKTISVINSEKKLIEKSIVILKGDKEIPSYTFINDKDSSKTVRYYYNKKFTKTKVLRTITKHKNKKGLITRTNQIRQVRGTKNTFRNTYYQYFKNGLIKSTSSETINSKSKLTYQTKSNFYYVYKSKE